jgi:small neutral amino acid transporter SnatA (MarC family)
MPPLISRAMVILLFVFLGNVMLILALPIPWRAYGMAGGFYLFAVVYGWLTRPRGSF